MRIAQEGFLYIGILSAVGLVLALYPPTRLLSIPVFVLAAFVTYFFRDPDRTPPEDPRLWVSPADGTVVYVGPEKEGAGDRIQVSIFLSIFSVHINRSPLSGRITNVRYTPGRFLPAYRGAGVITERTKRSGAHRRGFLEGRGTTDRRRSGSKDCVFEGRRTNISKGANDSA